MLEPGLPTYVADIHSLIWYRTDSPRLSPAANRCFNLIEEGKGKLLIPAIKEMHDRLIVCEALLNSAKIITKDKKIKEADVVEVL